MTTQATIRGELREWREVYLNDTSYFVGRLYGDRLKIKKDGTMFTTGFIIQRLDRGDYFLARTAGIHVYILYKDKKDGRR